MSDASENRPVSTPGAAEPPMPKLPAHLAPPAAPGSEPAAAPPLGSEAPAPVARPVLSPTLGSEASAVERSGLEPAAIDPSAIDPSAAPAAIAPAGERTAGDVAADKRAALGLTRTSAAWLGVWAGLAAVIVLIVFMAQNTAGVEISFLGWSGHISLALALLIAGVAGAIVAMAIAAARIIQLRRLFRHHSR